MKRIPLDVEETGLDDAQEKRLTEALERAGAESQRAVHTSMACALPDKAQLQDEGPQD